MPGDMIGSSQVLMPAIDDDCLIEILAHLSATHASAAFSVSNRLNALAPAARELRLKGYWEALFKSNTGFPDVRLLSQPDVIRFESRLTNLHDQFSWRCLSCLRFSSQRRGTFCLNCIRDPRSFVRGNGGYVMSMVTCGHANLVYWCALCEASACRLCLMSGACTFCLLLSADFSAPGSSHVTSELICEMCEG